jgi:hypothetical protein
LKLFAPYSEKGRREEKKRKEKGGETGVQGKGCDAESCFPSLSPISFYSTSKMTLGRKTFFFSGEGGDVYGGQKGGCRGL